ncbi:MAG: PSD1 domain-containing protein [Pirellulaceae bacterium]|nr:PSD1 domain-containing protein [Pirellulaceae bacterium]
MLSLLIVVLSLRASIVIAQQSATEPQQADLQQADFFHNQVEPILRSNCFSCHSHEAQTMEGGLSLDWKSGWASGGTRGPAIVPGKPEESWLIRAIQHQDASLAMPEQKLSAADIEVLVRWVRDGAWDDRTLEPLTDQPLSWWSLTPLVAPPVPQSHASAGPHQHPIDAFIGAKLQEAGLVASPRARPHDLIRRLYYDLIGLPPSVEEIELFASDSSERAYAALVDQLLMSERYGERWARHWLDTIHFAESHGYEHDVGRDHAWPYRDYLINALNQDTVWSRLIREQLAADAFYPESTHLIPALGFLGAGTFDLSTYSTGPVTFDYLDRDDMVTQTMAAFVSTTANCARCHTHKFDPITQEDYYALQAVFSGVLKGDIRYDPDSTVAARRRHWTGLRDAAADRDPSVLLNEDSQRLVEVWRERHQTPAVWSELIATSFVSASGATLTRTSDGSRAILASGISPDTDTYTVTGSVSLPRVSAMRLEVLPHESLPMMGPGRCANGNLHLSEVTVTLFEQGSSQGKLLKIARATADFNQSDWNISHAIDGDVKTAWGIHPEVGQPHYAVFEFSEPTELPAGSQLTVSLRQLHGGSHLLGFFGLSFTQAPTSAVAALPRDVSGILKLPADQLNDGQRLKLAAHAVTEEADVQLSRLPELARVYAVGTVVEIPAGNGNYTSASLTAPKTVHLLRRGDIDKPAQAVAPGALSILQHVPARFTESESAASESTRRAALAEWIAHPQNPLTWRSVVNRTWHYHFGRGLSDTPSDLGRMGGLPSHPELLDWLAVWFRDQAGGSLKALHRLIVTSQTYQQSSAQRVEAARLDADNRLLWRQNRQRLDADSFRDWVLSASGKLDLSMGGPSNQHFLQSPGPQATPKLDYARYDWNSPGSNRRSIYRYVWRGIPDPLLAALDFPDLGLLSPTRSVSASPLQALTLMNHPFVLHFSQALSDEIRSQSHDNDALVTGQQVRQVVRYIYGREPHDSEAAYMVAYARRHGLAGLCRLLFNSNEFLFIL